MFAAMKARLTGGANRMQGRTDMLEAVCASAALVAAADGSIDDVEIKAAMEAVTANEVLANSFTRRDIENVMDTMLDRAEKGRVGRRNLMKELTDIANNHDDAEIVLLTALDIADADGKVDENEQKMLESIANTLGLKLSEYE